MSKAMSVLEQEMKKLNNYKYEDLLKITSTEFEENYPGLIKMYGEKKYNIFFNHLLMGYEKQIKE